MTPPKVGQVSEGILVKFSFQNSSKIYQVSILVGERRWLRNSWKKSQNSRNSDRKNRWLHLKSGKWAKEFPMHIRASKPSPPLYSFMLSCKVNQFPSSITKKKKSTNQQFDYKFWYFVNKICLTYCKKKLFQWSRKKLLKLKAEGWEFADLWDH